MRAVARSLRRILGDAFGGRRKATGAPLLTAIAPTFAEELQELLRARGQRQQAASIPALRVVELCNCDRPNCSTFYTIPRFVVRWRWPGAGRTLDLKPSEGTIRVDIIEDRIALVEVLDRPDVEAALAGAAPPAR